MRALLAAVAVQADLDPDRLSFTEGLFELTEMFSLALTLESEEAMVRLLQRLRHKMARHVLPPRDQADLSQVQTQETSGAST